MPILVQPVLDTKLRIWFNRLAASQPWPTGKSTLCQYLSTIDRIIPLNNDLLQEAIPLAAECDGCSEEEIKNALCNIAKSAAPTRSTATKAVHVLEALVARIASGQDAPDRVRIDPNSLQILDFLNKWFRSQPASSRRKQLGGAPAVMAQEVARLETAGHRRPPGSAKPKVALWTIYHSKHQASVFEPVVEFLQIDEQCNFSTMPAIHAGRELDPEVLNYAIEFGKDTPFEFNSSRDGAGAVTARRSDRVIAIAPGYRFYDPSSGSVDMDRAPSSVPLHLVAADPWHGPSCVEHVAQSYKYWIIGGLPNVSGADAQDSLESDLRSIPPDVTLHVEIAGPSPTPWFVNVLRQYVNSAGVNIDDIEQLTRTIAASDPTLPAPPVAPHTPDIIHEYHLRLAFWLLCTLNLERVYLHGLELDYVVRRHASDDQMNGEVRGDLLAKTAVTNRARGVDPADRPASTFGLPRSNLLAFIDLCAQRAYPVTDWASLEGLSEFEAILDCGWFDDTFDYGGDPVSCRVAIVPVGLFRQDPPGLRFVGAGDTTSAVSFVFGCFTTRGLKRSA